MIKNRVTLGIALFMMLGWGGVLVADTRAVLVDVEASEVYLPGGFDDNDNAQVVIEGYFPNTCYQVGPVTVDRDDHLILVRPQAYVQPGPCLQMIVHYERVIDLGLLEQGTYDVFVGNDLDAEPLSISASANRGPDDYLYAPVRSARLLSRQERTVRLEGIFSNTCMSIHEEDIIVHEPQQSVIAVLPVVRYRDSEEACVEQMVPFEVDVALDHPNLRGRHLIHVRSLNGASFNLIETF